MKNEKESLSQKPFKKADILVYVVLAVITALCFVLSAFAVEKGDSFDAYLSGKLVLRCSLEDGSYTIFDESTVQKVGENVFTIKSEKGYNELSVDLNAKEVFVTDADCIGKECKAMRLSSGSIICVPHSLIIKFTGEELSPRVG